ncbi:unnamed protein product [Brassica napus]|nr:unnamed protein product [Brassica napus]
MIFSFEDSGPFASLPLLSSITYTQAKCLLSSDFSSALSFPPCYTRKHIKTHTMRSHIMNFGNNILVMCDAYMPAGNPIPTNKRHNAAKIFSSSKVASEEPWYGIEQEYTLMQKGVNWKLIIVSIMSSSNIIQTTILISFLWISLLFGYRVLPLDNAEDLTMPTISKLQLRVLSVTSWLAEQFRQRTQVSGDDTKVLMELKYGKVEANLNP